MLFSAARGTSTIIGQQSRTESLFYYFRLEDQIPEDHLLRLVDRYVDFSFVRERLKDSYSSTGRPSIDPEVLAFHLHTTKAIPLQTALDALPPLPEVARDLVN